MTKKIVQSTQRKIKTQNESKEIANNELKTLAIKKVRELLSGNKTQSKISKRSFDNIENKRESTRVEKELFEEILDESVFECPVCLELMIEPTLLKCGHAYCFKCLEELMIYKSCCGVCRNVQNEPEFQRSKLLETMIESMILKKSQNYLDYYCRLTDTENWKRIRNIPIQELTKGGYIDFRDKELKWRKAEILKITYNEIFGEYDIVVKYKKDGPIIEEMIQSDSGRYTKFSYYTRMKYLEPKSNCNAMMEQFVEGEVMDIPFTGVEMREENGEIDMMRRVVEEDESSDELSSSNIEPENEISSFENYYYIQNEFLDELFNNNNDSEPSDLIELLV